MGGTGSRRRPGYLGAARGDLIEVDRVERSFAVIERGGNLSIHVYRPHGVADQALDYVRRLGGSLDGRARGLTVFTVPVSAGFAAVERCLEDSRRPTNACAGTTATFTTRLIESRAWAAGNNDAHLRQGLPVMPERAADADEVAIEDANAATWERLARL